MIRVATILTLVLALTACNEEEIQDASTTLQNAVENQDLQKPQVKVSNNQLRWSQSYASEYRVLLWLNDQDFSEHFTDKRQFNPALLGLTPGQYVAIVEAYDTAGNSLFSDPVNLEVL